MNRTELINHFIKKYDYKKYLEIGVFNPYRNFNKINIEYKIGIDPDSKTNPSIVTTSDNFFKYNKSKFDIIFIDGLHIKEQVIRDILNSLKFLTINGTIILHDCNPKDEISQKVPKETDHWNGNVWEAFVYIRTHYNGLNCFVIDTDEGCGIIQKNDNYKRIHIKEKINYNNFDKYKKKWLNLISIEDFLSNDS